MTPFSLAFHHATPHGILAAVHLPDSPDPVPEAALSGLHPVEAEHAVGLRGYRQAEFVGGRLALHAALTQLGAHPGAHPGAAPGPILPDERGAPAMPAGLAGSVSHKRTLAVALVARRGLGSIGVDLEDIGPERAGIEARVLTEAEIARIADLPPERRWIEVLIRFSLKEAIYKALDPYVRRYVGFQEAEVHPHVDGHALVALNLAQGEGPFTVDARFEWLRGRLCSSVRILPAPGACV